MFTEEISCYVFVYLARSVDIVSLFKGMQISVHSKARSLNEPGYGLWAKYFFFAAGIFQISVA